MLNIIKLFGHSPFAPLQTHMEKVTACVEQIKPLFEALEKQDYEAVHAIAKEMSKLEHFADLVKNDMRNHLPKGLFLPISRADLLEILSIQDSLADCSEDIAILLTFKKFEIPLQIKSLFRDFINLNIEAFEHAQAITKELDQLLEFSFGGIEAKKVKGLIDDVAFKEHEVDLLQRELLKELYNMEDPPPFTTFHLIQKIITAVAAISNLSEKLALRVRMTLELK